LNCFCVIRHKCSISIIVTSLSAFISVLSKRICFITMSRSSLGPVSLLLMDTKGKYLNHEVENTPPFSAVFRSVLKAVWGKTTISFTMSFAWNNSAFNIVMFMKFCITDFYKNFIPFLVSHTKISHFT